MGFFSFIQEIAMDLGTANTIIISDDKIVVDEPSVVALNRIDGKMIAVGQKAKMMYEKTHDNIRTLWQPPLLALTAYGNRCAFGLYRG